MKHPFRHSLVALTLLACSGLCLSSCGGQSASLPIMKDLSGDPGTFDLKDVKNDAPAPTDTPADPGVEIKPDVGTDETSPDLKDLVAEDHKELQPEIGPDTEDVEAKPEPAPEVVEEPGPEIIEVVETAPEVVEPDIFEALPEPEPEIVEQEEIIIQDALEPDLVDVLPEVEDTGPELPDLPDIAEDEAGAEEVEVAEDILDEEILDIVDIQDVPEEVEDIVEVEDLLEVEAEVVEECLGPPEPHPYHVPGAKLVEADFTKVGKAQPDEIYNNNGQDIPKTNQAYTWSLSADDERVWVGSVPNVLCLAFGPLGGSDLTFKSVNAVCEELSAGGEEPVDIFPDWREPEILTYDKATGNWAVRTEVMGSADEDGISDTTLGWRASVVFGDYYLAAGPGTGVLWGMEGYGTSIAIFKNGEFMGAKKLTENNEARKFLEMGGYLYLGSQKWNADGVILRWNGDESDLPDSLFEFAEVGIIDGEAAWLESYKGRIYAITWPSAFIGGGDGFKLFRSPVIPDCGLTEENAFEWELVFSYSDYDPDPVSNQLAGGGAMIVYQDALYFGSMHVPFQHKCANPADMINCSLEKYSHTDAFSVFKLVEDDEGTVDVECLFGEDKGGALVPTLGAPGFGNPYNNYFWSVSVHDGWLYVGTMDFSRFLVDALAAYGLPFIPGIFKPYEAFGFDLWATDDGVNWQSVGIDGFGNEFNWGARQMISDGESLWLGTANPFNLSSQGGWELWQGVLP